MKSNTGKLTGTGRVIRADGTVVKFAISSDMTKEQADRLKLKSAETQKENR